MARGTWLFTPRTAYEWTLHANDEGTYTNYAADNPPNGVIITFYQKEPQKGAPALDILDAHGRVIRSVSGTHKVGGKDVPYIPNKAGLNRYTWDFNVNGPVKWNGATLDFFKGPDTGPGVVPGHYSVRMTLSGHTYVQHFRVAPDPRSQFTQADYQRTLRRGDASDGASLADRHDPQRPRRPQEVDRRRRSTPRRRRTTPR